MLKGTTRILKGKLKSSVLKQLEKRRFVSTSNLCLYSGDRELTVTPHTVFLCFDTVYLSCLKTFRRKYVKAKDLKVGDSVFMYVPFPTAKDNCVFVGRRGYKEVKIDRIEEVGLSIMYDFKPFYRTFTANRFLIGEKT